MKKILLSAATILLLNSCSKTLTEQELSLSKRGFWKLFMVKETVGVNKFDTTQLILNFIDENQGESFSPFDKDSVKRKFTWKSTNSGITNATTLTILIEYSSKDNLFYNISNVTPIHESWNYYKYKFLSDYDYRYTGTIDKL